MPSIPAERGGSPSSVFPEAAEKFGYIIVGSNGSKNGPWGTHFPVDFSRVRNRHTGAVFPGRREGLRGRLFGGARAAALFAAITGVPAAGVVGCGAGLPEGVGLDRIPIPAYYGIAGIEDFNFLEMKELGKDLERARIPNWIEVFDGGHEWPPASVCEGALEWMDLRAMKENPSLRDESRIAALLSGLLTAAASFEAAGDIPRAVERCRKSGLPV